MINIPPQMIQMIKSGGNPQAILINMLKNNHSPMANNIIGMINSNDYSGVEQMARNMCSAKGIDVDELMSSIQNQFR